MTRVIFRFVFALFAWVCLSGCPSDYHYLEELYFKDDYIQATIKAAQIGENRKSRRELKKFFSQNSKPLKKKSPADFRCVKTGTHKR